MDLGDSATNKQNYQPGLPHMKFGGSNFLYIYMYMRARLQENVCMCWHGWGTEGMRGHVWGTCCGNRYMCGFIGGEVKAEGCSCSCLEGLIYANNKRKEVKSRNWPCARVIRVLQSAMHVSLTVHIIGIYASKSQRSNFRFSILVPFLGYCLWDKDNKLMLKSQDLMQKFYFLYKSLKVKWVILLLCTNKLISLNKKRSKCMTWHRNWQSETSPQQCLCHPFPQMSWILVTD